jgi:hypothetical protein
MEDMFRDVLCELVGIHSIMLERLLPEAPTPVLATLFRDLGTTYLVISASLEADDKTRD